MVTRMIREPRAADLLVLVGERVRRLRARRGITRRMLAHDSSVSERYLAQLEQGQGNISIALLQQIAEALGTDLAELLSHAKDPTPEEELISELVGELTPDDQRRALELLGYYFSKQHSRVALLGMRGAGKTTLGRRLADHYGVAFVRIGREIERLAGMKVSEILSLTGQSAYRRLEEQALLATFRRHERCVIETGGGVVSEPGTFNVLLTNCFVIWLRATPEEHMQRVIQQGDLRPMQSNEHAMADLQRILAERTPYYSKAHATVDTSDQTVEKCFEELVELTPFEARSPATA